MRLLRWAQRHYDVTVAVFAVLCALALAALLPVVAVR